MFIFMVPFSSYIGQKWYDSHMCRRQQPAIWVSIFVEGIHNYKPSVGVL